MLQALEAPLNRAPTVRVRTIPCPIKGWNTRDKLTERRDSADYAPILINLVPANSRLQLRAGHADHATGLPASDVESILEYDAGGTQKLFAAVGTEIYDATTAGAVGAAAVTGLTNAQWQHIMHATTSGQYLIAVNGADGVRTYSGAAWATQSITGATAANFIALTSHQARLWFAEKQTLNLWYLATYAISGAATKLDLGALCEHGGELVAVSTWTYDGGAGPDDQLVAITSQGEVIVYVGTDPSSSSTWSLKGVYKIDKPLGRRCMVKLGADLAILTESGVVQLSAVLNTVAGKDAFSDVIRDEFVSAAVARDTFGWQLSLYPKRGWLIVNVPTLTPGEFDQYVFNTLNGAWTKFRGMNAICWHASGDALYFGGADGGFFEADSGLSDDGSNIEWDYQPAWSRFGTSQKKRFTLARVNFFTDGDPAPLINMRADYDDRAPTASPNLTVATTGSVWDDDAWDDAVWGGGLAASSNWITVTGAGIVGAPRIKGATVTAEVAIVSVDVAFEVGGIL